MTTTPPPEQPEPSDSGDAGSDRPAEPNQSPSSPRRTSENGTPESSQTPGPQYPAPPPLPPEAFPTYGGGPGYEYGQYGAPPVRRRNNMGVAALVLGIAAFLISPLSILAIVFGRIGLNRAARGEATNRGVAQAGFVLGIIALALWVLALILLARQ